MVVAELEPTSSPYRLAVLTPCLIPTSSHPLYTFHASHVLSSPLTYIHSRTCITVFLLIGHDGRSSQRTRLFHLVSV